MNQVMREFAAGNIGLAAGPLKSRFELNKQYVMSLTEQNLLRCFYLEAGLWSYSGNGGTTTESTTSMDGPESWHWGWESPTCELRGHIIGHWLSAAARIFAQTNDTRVKAKLDFIVQELARCQEANGGEWLAAFPEKYMYRIANGKWVWAPHYTIHKLLMGLYETYHIAKNPLALDIMKRIAAWFHRWTSDFSQNQMDELLDLETGGMLEVWANLYDITKDKKHFELINRYDRRRFFDALLNGQDVLTNKHANTQIPEILGAARAWEVTGDERFRKVVETFWKLAVTDRGYVCTGAGDNGELWMPQGEMSARLGIGQEHCCNYNMMNLAQVLFRWTGNPIYADYWEKRFINGTLVHQNGTTGMISYFIGVGAGSQKKWGSATQHFWCCHGTLMQTHASYEQQIFMEDEQGIAVCQWIPADIQFKKGEATVKISLQQDGQFGLYPLNEWSVKGMIAITKVDSPPIPVHRPNGFVYQLEISCDRAAEFIIKLRLPWWLKGEPIIKINGIPWKGSSKPSTFCEIKRIWNEGDIIEVEFPKELSTEFLPGGNGEVAFMDGPIVLAGIVEEERLIYGSRDKLDQLLAADRERNHSWWNPGHYRTINQERAIRFIPLYEVKDEMYTIYFQLKS